MAKKKSEPMTQPMFHEPSPQEQRRMAIQHAARMIADATTAPARKRVETQLERAITRAVKDVKAPAKHARG